MARHATTAIHAPLMINVRTANAKAHRCNAPRQINVINLALVISILDNAPTRTSLITRLVMIITHVPQVTTAKLVSVSQVLQRLARRVIPVTPRVNAINIQDNAALLTSQMALPAMIIMHVPLAIPVRMVLVNQGNKRVALRVINATCLVNVINRPANATLLRNRRAPAVMTTTNALRMMHATLAFAEVRL
jgi:hypothetical protein